MRPCITALVAMCAALCWDMAAAPCRANDSSAELSVGGLVLSKNAGVAIETEELSISAEAVSVRYVFRNQTPSPISLTVAFPLPDIDLSEGANIAFPVNDPVNFVGFSTHVDGKPIAFAINQRAFVNGKDVTDLLRGLNIPILPMSEQQLKLNELAPQLRDRALAAGAIVQFGANDKGEPHYEPAWTLKTSVVRQQTFPPDRPIVVEHRYRPSIGMSFDSVLRQAMRESKAMEAEVQRYKTTYCIQDDLIRSLDRIAGSGEASKTRIVERRISYVLSSGANWAGPIKDFHLVVDKGEGDRLISFCGNGVRKISPTAFELRARDFVPDRDLNILILGRT
jgi:hypothetical protein